MKPYDLFVPITRTVEGQNGRFFVFGVLPFDDPDSFDTVLTRDLALASQELLRKYPTMRFMHRDPIGKIVWDEAINDPQTGQPLQTQIADNGFSVLGEVDPACQKERSLISNGKFGFSYGYLPAGVQPMKESKKDGKQRIHFTTGKIYEFSVVDTPSNFSAECKSFVRLLDGEVALPPESEDGIEEMLSNGVSQTTTTASLSNGVAGSSITQQANAQQSAEGAMLRWYDALELAQITILRSNDHDGGIERELTAEARDKLPDSDFALVIEKDGKKIRKLPIHDKAHAIAAAQALSGARGGVDIPAGHLDAVKRKVHAALVKFGVDPKNYSAFKEERNLDENLKKEISELIKTEIAAALQPTVERINGLQKQVEAIPAEHSPAEGTQPVTRAMPIGVKAMLEAATGGKQ